MVIIRKLYIPVETEILKELELYSVKLTAHQKQWYHSNINVCLK